MVTSYHFVCCMYSTVDPGFTFPFKYCHSEIRRIIHMNMVSLIAFGRERGLSNKHKCMLNQRCTTGTSGLHFEPSAYQNTSSSSLDSNPLVLHPIWNRWINASRDVEIIAYVIMKITGGNMFETR